MEPVLFLSVVIIALTEIVKKAVPERIHGFLTIIVAILLGVAVSLAAEPLGIAQVSIAEGIVAALGAIGITSAASKASPEY